MSNWDDGRCDCASCDCDDCPRWASGFRWGGLFGTLAGAAVGAVLTLLRMSG